jgi:hypothetical protein
MTPRALVGLLAVAALVLTPAVAGAADDAERALARADAYASPAALGP